MNLIERPGISVRRIKESYQKTGCSPEFQIYDSSITVILPVIGDHGMMTKEQADFFELLNPNILYSRKDLESLTGFGRSKLMRILGELQDSKRIRTQGTGRSTRYAKI